jgi:hypothetical protein
MKEGKYIYCIIKSKNPKTFGPLGIGERGDELYTVCFNGLAVVVSNSPITKYSTSRDNLISHEKAIEEVMKEHAVLPVRFATITDNEENLKKILEKEHGRFKELLDKIKDKKELGLKAIFNEGLIYGNILEKYEGIRILKKKIALVPPQKSYYERMQIGKMVEDALQKEKEICKKEILDNLSPLAAEVKINNTYGERMIINSAFLIEKHREPEFDKKVNELSDKYGDKIKFKYVGTLPPFNFVNLVIETGSINVFNR